MSRTRVAAHVAAILLACMRADLVGQSAQTAAAVDREYVLDATMLGYRGVGGEIDGVRNPTLWARPGETVRITMINGETMVHDVVLEKLGIKSPQILDKGATTSITFKASESDTYFCSVPGHRQAGMAGRLEVSAEPRPIPEGAAPAANGRAAQPGFRERHTERLDSRRRRVRARQGREPDRDAQRACRHVLDQQRRRRECAEGLAVVRSSSR